MIYYEHLSGKLSKQEEKYVLKQEDIVYKVYCSSGFHTLERLEEDWRVDCPNINSSFKKKTSNKSGLDRHLIATKHTINLGIDIFNKNKNGSTSYRNTGRRRRNLKHEIRSWHHQRSCRMPDSTCVVNGINNVSFPRMDKCTFRKLENKMLIFLIITVRCFGNYKVFFKKNSHANIDI